MPAHDTIDAQILDLMLRAGTQWVLWLLLGLSVLAVMATLERIWFFWQERRSPAVAQAIAALRQDGPAAALKQLEGARSMEATVARNALKFGHEGVEAVEEHIAAALESERLRFERGLAFLGTLGNNAPFVGLFGTVLGIIRAFNDLSGNLGQGSQAVMAGIAEALVATGVGLLVALPAVAAFNTFTRRVEMVVASASGVSHEILAFMKARAGSLENTTKGGH
jgi:biopolymer transport protein ExbB/TolQ